MLKQIRLTLLASCVCFGIFTQEAKADPFSIGVAVLSGVASTTGVFLGISPTLIGSIAVAGLQLGLQFGLSALARPKGSNPGDFKAEFQSQASGAIYAFGRVRIAGLEAFGNASGLNRDRVIWHSEGELIAIEEHFLGGRAITINPDNGAVESPPWAKIGNDSYAFIKTQYGTGNEVAWPDLIGRYPNQITADHKGLGIAQTHKLLISPGVNSPKYLKLYGSDSNPPYAHTARYRRIYDPRIDDINTPESWGWSDNGALIATHVLMMYPDLGPDDFDWPKIIIAANKCDTLRPTKAGGAEKWARAWGAFTGADNRTDVMRDLKDSIGANIRLNDQGQIYIEMITDNPTPEFTLRRKHVIDSDGPARPVAAARENKALVKYYSPERGYESWDLDVSGTRWHEIAENIAAYGVKHAEFILPYCPSATQAQHNARRMFALKNGKGGTVVMNMSGLVAYGAEYGLLEMTDSDEVILIQTQIPRIDFKSGTVEVPYIEWPILPEWDVNLDEALPPPAIPEFEFETDVATPDAPTLGQSALLYGTAIQELRVAIDTNGQPIAEAQYRMFNVDGDPLPWVSMTEFIDADYPPFATAAVDMRTKRVQFRSRVANEAEDVSKLSEIYDVNSIAYSAAAMVAPVAIGTPSMVFGSGSNWRRCVFSGVLVPQSLNAVALQLSGDFATHTVSARLDQPVTFVANNTNTSVAPHIVVTVNIRAVDSQGNLGPAYTFTASNNAP